MDLRSRLANLSTKDLERLLAETLVPVEPDVQFIRRLRARLVDYRGEGVSTGWAVVIGLAISALFMVLSIGFALRLLMALLGLMGILNQRKASRQERPTTA